MRPRRCAYALLLACLEQLPLLPLLVTLLLLLPPHVLANLFFVDAHRADAVTPPPQMSSPVLPPQPLVLPEQPRRQLPFQVAHHLRHGILGWYPQHQMDMVGLHVQLQDLQTVLLPQQLVNLLLRVLCNRVLEYPVAILWTKYDVIFTLVECVREFPAISCS